MNRPDVERTRRTLLQAGAGALLAALAGCVGDGGGTGGGGESAESGGDGGGGTAEPSPTDPPTATDATGATASPTGTPAPTTTGGAAAWRTTELTDVLTGETFTVAGFEGRPVLVEFFAVWCPVCTDQQREIGRLLDRREDVVAISLDVDPNEDAKTVEKHATVEGFDWRYAVAPTSLTRALVDEFGTVVTSPPSAPVVRVCPDGTAALVSGRGVKSADDLAAAFAEC